MAKKRTTRPSVQAGRAIHSCPWPDVFILSEFEKGALFAGIATAAMLAWCLADWMVS